MVQTRQSKTLTVKLADGCEIMLTLVRPRGVSDRAFEAQVRRAEEVLSAISGSAAVPTTALQETVDAPATGEGAEVLAEAPATAPVLNDRKLYVGNLPYAWTEEPLRELFAAQGVVTRVEIARFGRNGRSRGFAFVEMNTPEEAQTAIAQLHDALAGDRKMVVRLARNKEERPQKSAERAPSADQPVVRQGRLSAPRRGRGPRQRPPSAPRSDRPRRDSGITNNSGYEIYLRDESGGFATEPTARSAAVPNSNVEPSPYMEDTGDVENRPPRSPRRRRR
jgi:cold-inducible RNA-binding protein